MASLVLQIVSIKSNFLPLWISSSKHISSKVQNGSFFLVSLKILQSLSNHVLERGFAFSERGNKTRLLAQVTFFRSAASRRQVTVFLVAHLLVEDLSPVFDVLAVVVDDPVFVAAIRNDLAVLVHVHFIVHGLEFKRGNWNK